MCFDGYRKMALFRRLNLQTVNNPDRYITNRGEYGVDLTSEPDFALF
jgi:hypothetical protein